MLNLKMPRQPDPRTETRRERFRAYCRSKGWKAEGEDWKITDIAAATKKARSKVSDLLNANGSFGSAIARDLEDALGLPDFFFDGREGVAAEGEESFEQLGYEMPTAPATVEQAFELLAQILSGMNPLGRELASTALATLGKEPEGYAKTAELLESLARIYPRLPDPSPTPGTRKAKTTSPAPARREGKAHLSLKIGGGNNPQFNLPLRTVKDPFNSKQATASERKWYETLRTAPKAKG